MSRPCRCVLKVVLHNLPTHYGVAASLLYVLIPLQLGLAGLDAVGAYEQMYVSFVHALSCEPGSCTISTPRTPPD